MAAARVVGQEGAVHEALGHCTGERGGRREETVRAMKHTTFRKDLDTFTDKRIKDSEIMKLHLSCLQCNHLV